MLLHLAYISLIVSSFFLISDGSHSHYLMRSNENKERDMCVRQQSVLVLMAKVIAKLEQLSRGQKDMLSKLKLIRKDNEELLRGQKRLEKLIKDKYDKYN